MATIYKYIQEQTNIGDKSFTPILLRIYYTEEESITDNSVVVIKQAIKGIVSSKNYCNSAFVNKNFCIYFNDISFSGDIIFPKKSKPKAYYTDIKSSFYVYNTKQSYNKYDIKDISIKNNLIWAKNPYNDNFWVYVDLTDDENKILELGFTNGYKENLKIKDIIFLNTYGIKIIDLEIGQEIAPNETKLFNVKFLYPFGVKELYKNKLTIEFENGVKISYRLCLKRNFTFLPPTGNRNYQKTLFDQTRFFNRILSVGEISLLYKEVSFFEINNKNVQFSFGLELPEIEIIDAKIINENNLDKLNVKYRVLNPLTQSPIKFAGEGVIEAEE